MKRKQPKGAVRDWADESAQRFYLTHAKFCQGPDADTESVSKWLRALAEKFRAIAARAKKGKP